MSMESIIDYVTGDCSDLSDLFDDGDVEDEVEVATNRKFYEDFSSSSDEEDNVSLAQLLEKSVDVTRTESSENEENTASNGEDDTSYHVYR